MHPLLPARRPGEREAHTIDRRTFLAGTGAVLLGAPLAVGCQRLKKVWRIGYLSARSSPPNLGQGPFRQGLHDLGYVEGQDFVMEFRWAEGHPDRLPELAADLVRAHVNVIVTEGTPATYAAMQATKTIPIVFASAGAVVEKGIVASLARPGGNVTGLTLQNPSALKLYQLLKEAAPRVTRGIYVYVRVREVCQVLPSGLTTMRWWSGWLSAIT